MAAISKKDLLKSIKPILKKEAEKAMEDFYWKAQEAVGTFYDDYDPRYYDRSYELYSVISRIEPYEIDNGYRCGIKITPTLKFTDHDPGDYVFQGAFDLGFHGTSDIWVTEPSPWQRIQEIYNSIK